VGGRYVEPELRDQARQAGHLALGNLHHQPGERRRVDDRVLERALEAASHEPGVERVMAVLHQHRPMREPKERSPCVFEHRRADEHRAVDVVAPARVWVDGRAAVDERVEKRQRAVEGEALRPKLQDEEWRVAGRLDVQGDELSLVQERVRPDLGRVDGDLLPRNRCRRPARLEEKRSLSLVRAHCVIEKARLANAISSWLTARTSKAAIA
jgi:hypothetical protein